MQKFNNNNKKNKLGIRYIILIKFKICEIKFKIYKIYKIKQNIINFNFNKIIV